MTDKLTKATGKSEKSGQVEAHFHKTYRHFDSFYDENKGLLARIIDRLFRGSMRMRYRRVLESAAPYEDKSVLDVGCGAGRYTIGLARLGIRRGLGIDFARNMIEEAQRRALEHGVDRACEFRRGDFMELATDHVFDHVFAMGVLDYIADPAAFVARMVSHCKGSVMVSFPSSGGLVQWFRRIKFEKIQKCPIYFYREADVRGIAEKVLAGVKGEYRIEKMAKDYFLTINVS